MAEAKDSAIKCTCVEAAKVIVKGEARYMERGDEVTVDVEDAYDLIGSGRFVTDSHLPNDLIGEGRSKKKQAAA